MSVVTLPARPRRLPADPSPDARHPRKRPEPRPKLAAVPPMHGGGRARRVGKRIALLAAVAAILSAPFALVVVHLELTTNQLRLTNLQSQGDAAQKTYEKLRLEVAQLESPARIVATAQQLGMVTPTTIHYLTATTPSPAATNVEPQATPGLNGWATAKQVDAGR